MLVGFEGVRDLVCFKENKISCMKLHQITCINTNANTEGGIGLETRANTSEVNSGMKATKFPIGTRVRWVGLSLPDGERYSETSTSVGRS